MESLISGEFIPLAFISGMARKFFILLPFRYTLSFPVEVFIGDIEIKDMLFGFFIGIMWLTVLCFYYKLIYKKAIKRYEAEGI